MTSAIRHRGPDDFGFFAREQYGVYLGHRRLSIVDVAGGHQPMPNEDGSRHIVFNGEIFNHSAMRPELERAGHVYKTHCDTETLLHSYEEYGPASLGRFRGMFSYVIWDEPKRTLFAARDRLGIKPFYYYWDGKLFAFASEIKALLEHPGISTEPEDSLLPEYLAFGYCSGDRTLFRGIRKLMPGHHLTLRHLNDRLDLKIERYWDVPEPAAVPKKSDAEWIHEVRQGLEETVKLRLMADVPLGTFLSGGLDSSAITALVGRMTNEPVKTFSVGYQEAQYSELGYASQVAKTLGTEHHEVVVGRDEFLSALPRLIWHEDEPITWPSSVSLFFVSHLASQHVKVVLTGEGSDELFGGYERYRWNLHNTRASSAYASVLPGGLRRSLKQWIGATNLLRASARRKISHTFIGRDNSVESLLLDNFYGAFALEDQQRLLSSSPDQIYGNYLAYWNSRPQAELLSRMLYADQKTYLVELLMKQDQMSMAASIESRVPFLDHQFLALAMSLPDNMKIRGAEQKYVLKKAVEDLLPHDIIYRAKMGFPTPLRQWFRESSSDFLLNSLLQPDSFLSSRLDMTMVRELLDRHRGGLEDATDRLWRLLNLELWGQIFFDGKKDSLLERSAHLTFR